MTPSPPWSEPSPPARPPLDRARLALGSPWRTVEVLDESPSTNAELARRAREGAPEGLVVVAEHQSAGRGRLDRVWVTPPRAALTFSALLCPVGVPPAQWPWLPLLVGVAVARGVRRAAGVSCVLKWPNDVLIGERKVAGILVERVERPDGAAAVVGVGVNVSFTAAELPQPTATSLTLEGGGSDRTLLLGEVLTALGHAYGDWSSAGGDPARELRDAYTELCSTVGQQVRVELPDGERLLGRAAGVDLGGRLKVATAGGEVLLGAGDVVHVRMA